MSAMRLARTFHTFAAARHVSEITSAAQFQTLLKAEKPAFIDFYATWCGPCKMVAPFVESMSNQTTDVDFYKLDVDDPNVRDVVMQLQITAMPTFLAFKDGQEFNRIVGADPRKIKSVVEDLAQ